jgi:thioredoxin-like negative regulator of GroEL
VSNAELARRFAAGGALGTVLFLLLATPAVVQESPAPPEPPPVLPFLEDDYGQALEQARARKLPLFVEAWAPWSQTCRSLKAFVFTDKALRPRAAQFVWLSIDTEKKSSAPFLLRYPIEAWPSLLVVDAQSERVVLRWVGGATVSQLEKLLDDGRGALRGRATGVAEILARADRLYGESKNAEAAAAYREALAKAPARWRPYPRVAESLVFALQGSGDHAACATTARDAFSKLRETPSAANLARRGLECALEIAAQDPARPALVAELAADGREVISGRRRDIAADELSSLYAVLAEERDAAGDTDGRRKVLSEWASYLEARAAEAKTPAARAVFDCDRLEAYLALGEPRRAVPMLEASADDLSDDYNPNARLALAYEAMKDYENALQASDGALSKVYGPRLIVLLTVRSRICRENGDLVSARIALEEAVREAEALPPGQRSESQIASIRQKLEELPP